MELKLGLVEVSSFRDNGLNRTFVELKPTTLLTFAVVITGLNRTFVELKPGNPLSVVSQSLSLNRTFVELKQPFTKI